MSLLTKAESISLLVARELALGVQPTSGFQTLQPNADGVGDFYPKNKTIAPEPLSRFRQRERPEIVDSDATPKIAHDWTKDFADAFAEGIFLARALHTGGTGVAYFTNQTAVPMITARTATAYIVSAAGALQQGTLVVPRGWVAGANAAANGTPQVVGPGATATSIPVAGGVAETPAGAYVVTLEVAGFRGAAGDIGLDVNGNITSIVADFTTAGVVPGMVIWVGGTIGGANAFAIAGYRGFAKVVAVSTHLITLSRRQWTVGAADPGATKLIDLYWGRWLRNVAFDDVSYLEQSYHMELGLPGVGLGGVTEYVYSAGNLPNVPELTSPGQNIINAAITFLGTTVGDPGTARAAGASTAAGLLAIDRLTSVSKLKYLRVLNQATEAVVSSDIDNWKITFSNNVTGQKQQGTLGNARPITGKAQVDLDAECYLTQDEGWKACSANTPLMFGAGFRNADGGWFFDIPSLTFNDAPPKFPGNGPVSLNVKGAGFRDATGNYTLAMTMFPYLPNG